MIQTRLMKHDAGLQRTGASGRTRRGTVIYLTAIAMVVILSFGALAVDIGRLYVARAELQACADASALAASWELLDEDRLKGYPYMEEEIAAARAQAVEYGALNGVLGGSPEVHPFGDVTFGYLSDPTDPNEALATADPTVFNSVRVKVRRNSIRNGPVTLHFAPILGKYLTNLGAEATATFKDGAVGYEVTPQSGNAELMPIALKTTSWSALLNHSVTAGDNYSYDKETGEVVPGPDGIPELNLYPGAGENQLPPGNFGTIDIGSSNNATPDLARQIRYGISAADLAYHGGRIELPMDFNGDTGLSAAIKDDLEFIKGRPRAIPLFTSVSGPGNNAMYTMTGFGGIRVMDVKLTGPMKKKHVIVQPAYVVDDAVITAAGSGSSYFVYTPSRLSR